MTANNHLHLEVWLDADLIPNLTRVGTLAHDRGVVRFSYDPEWLSSGSSFVVDPDLSLDQGDFFPDARKGNFGVFLDSSPDRWGQRLMDRREAIQARDEDRRPRKLLAWDYLLGVQDSTRMGALRFRYPGTEVFLDNQPLPAPPVTSLRELGAIALNLTDKRKSPGQDELRQWLRILVAPGASLGGAHPKANFTDENGHLWIAKFPARDDEYDIGAWEKVAHDLAAKAGIGVPKSDLKVFGAQHHTFCVQRFDRVYGSGRERRRFFTSAMTLLKKDEGDSGSYLDLAEFISRQGAAQHIHGDLAQLFRRVAFNVLIGNRDDHLRNHGFIREVDGWRLSLAYDMNPNPYKDEHVLAIDESDPRPSLQALLGTADFYRLHTKDAELIVRQVTEVVHTWQAAARKQGLRRSDIELMENAFCHAPSP